MAAEDLAYQSEWCETCRTTVSSLRNHPSVVTWVLFNESWGQFDSAANTQMVWDLDPHAAPSFQTAAGTTKAQATSSEPTTTSATCAYIPTGVTAPS